MISNLKRETRTHARAFPFYSDLSEQREGRSNFGASENQLSSISIHLQSCQVDNTQHNIQIDSKSSTSILFPLLIDPTAMFYPLPALVNLVLFFCLSQSGMSISTQHFQLKPILLHVSEYSQPRRCTITVISSLVRNQSPDSGQINLSQRDSRSTTIDPALCGQLLYEPGRPWAGCFASKSISTLSSLNLCSS